MPKDGDISRPVIDGARDVIKYIERDRQRGSCQSKMTFGTRVTINGNDQHGECEFVREMVYCVVMLRCMIGICIE